MSNQKAPKLEVSSKSPPNFHQNPPKSSKINSQDDIFVLLIKEPEPTDDTCLCIYCRKTFARSDSRCKSKLNFDELQKLKLDMENLLVDYKNLLNEHKEDNHNQNDKKIIENNNNDVLEARIINNNVINNSNNNNNNQINKGVIMNNTMNVQIVQFGNEDIDKLNIADAMKAYLKSTGGNIASTMLKYINLNKLYPENNNIYITDLSREIVKIHNGTKFVYKKIKNIKDELLANIMKTDDIKNKLRINDVSLKIIDGVSAEDIVREEIKQKEKEEKLLKNIDLLEDNSETEEERDFTFEERLRIEHLENKRNGMQKKTFENIKEELYNCREFMKN